MLSTQEPNRPQLTGDEAAGPVAIAVALRWSPEQLAELDAALGPEFEVKDIRRASSDTALVIVPPCSPGTIRAILHDFPMAQVVVVEGKAGPVERVLRAGASDYVRSTTRSLADSVRATIGRLALHPIA